MKEFKQTAALLKAVDGLKGYIDKAPIRNLTDFEKGLSKVELQMNVNQTAVKKFHSEVESFLSEYNSIINTMSQNFLLWNAMLSKWEEKVAKNQQKKDKNYRYRQMNNVRKCSLEPIVSRYQCIKLFVQNNALPSKMCYYCKCRDTLINFLNFNKTFIL